MAGHDLVIVGGGIAGSALAAAVAAAGVDVVLLEREIEFRDRVRGEFMHAWGAAEMLTLGLEQPLLDCGGGWCTQIIGYNEFTSPEAAEATAVPLDLIVPGAPGAMCVGHPQASEALNTHAGACGASVVRGVRDVEVTAGAQPSVSYELDGERHDVSCRMVIGADGRMSTVRRTLGIGLETIESPMVLGGMLVRAERWSSQAAFIGVEGERLFLAFPRPHDLVRLYLCREPSELTAGANRAQHMLDAFRLNCVPNSEALATADPIGPCSYFPGSDSWTDGPVVEGAVLVGDAAGWSDPILGCGLSVAMRDARSVADVLRGDDWSVGAFEGYVAERATRMRRLLLTGQIVTELSCTFTDEGRERRRTFGERFAEDELVGALRSAAVMGPEHGPDEAFSEATVARALAYAD